MPRGKQDKAGYRQYGACPQAFISNLIEGCLLLTLCAFYVSTISIAVLDQPNGKAKFDISGRSDRPSPR